MDTTYVNIMLVVFLVMAALAIDVGYMYVSDEDLQHAAELSALAGAQGIKQSTHALLQSDSHDKSNISEDTVQASARVAAIESATGAHNASALVEIRSNNTNNMTTENSLTVGNWNSVSKKYSPGETPVNAMQVRTQRTAESESVGLGGLGTFLAKITGMETVNFNPSAIAAFPAMARANVAFSAGLCQKACRYPDICAVPERKMTHSAESNLEEKSRYAFTTLALPVADPASLSEMICREIPPQDVCGRNVFITLGSSENPLRDIESMMYNPKFDESNKEYDKKTGKMVGWWVIAPVVESLPENQGNTFEEKSVNGYALVRISRVCVTGATGCSQKGTSFDAPAAECGNENGLFIDRISCAGCGTREMQLLPGLHPVLVK